MIFIFLTICSQITDIIKNTDIRRKIAEALDIDMSALNDIDIQTEKDAIRALFYLEEKYEMDIKKTDREIRLTFDIDNTDIWKLIEYLEEWATKKEEYIKKKGNTTGEFQWKIYDFSLCKILFHQDYCMGIFQ